MAHGGRGEACVTLDRQPPQHRAFGAAFGSYLAPGVHVVHVSTYGEGDAELWLKWGCAPVAVGRPSRPDSPSHVGPPDPYRHGDPTPDGRGGQGAIRVPVAATLKLDRMVVPSVASTVAVAEPVCVFPSSDTDVVAVTRWIPAKPLAL